jgi:hypothetical protein
MDDDARAENGSSGLGQPGAERDDDLHVVRVRVQLDQAKELLQRREFDFGDHPNLKQNPDGSARLLLFVTRAQIQNLEAEGFAVEVGPNMSASSRERIGEIGRGNRFEGGGQVHGLGLKIGGNVRPSDQGGRA